MQSPMLSTRSRPTRPRRRTSRSRSQGLPLLKRPTRRALAPSARRRAPVRTRPGSKARRAPPLHRRAHTAVRQPRTTHEETPPASRSHESSTPASPLPPRSATRRRPDAFVSRPACRCRSASTPTGSRSASSSHRQASPRSTTQPAAVSFAGRRRFLCARARTASPCPSTSAREATDQQRLPFDEGAVRQYSPSMHTNPPRRTDRSAAMVLLLLAACPPAPGVPDGGAMSGGGGAGGMTATGGGASAGGTAGGGTAGGGATGGGTAGGAVDAGRTDGGSPGRFLAASTEAVIATRIRCGFYATSYVLPPTSLSNLESYEAVDRAAADGRLAFDAVRAEQCLALLASQPCLETADPPVCDGVLTGRVPEGGDCYVSSECAPGAGRCLGNTCPRKCVGLSQEGEFSTSARPCGSGLRADASGICVRLIIQAEGQDCLSVDGGIRTCERNLFCRRTSPTMGTCSRPIAAGASCLGTDICELGSTCTSGACLRYSGLNEPCSPSPLSSDARRCQVGLHCTAPTPTSMGLCQLPGASGTPCWGDCAAGLLCLGANYNPGMAAFGTCGAPTMVGVICSSNAECGEGRYCEPPASSPVPQCQVFRLLGETCSATERCASPFRCRLGRCERECHDLTP